MKKVIIGVFMALSCNPLPVKTTPQSSKIIVKIKTDTIYIDTIQSKGKLQIGDRFFFGYNEHSVSLFRVVDFNKDGVFAVWNFQSDHDDAHWFPLKDVYNSVNFKILTK